MTKKHITLNKQQVSFIIRKSKRARRMRIAVYCNGDIVVTAPLGIKKNFIEKFIKNKSVWVLDKIDFFKSFIKSDLSIFNKKHYIDNKDKALRIISGRIEFFNTKMVFKYNDINIKNQKTKWGSCSKKGNLNFNYKIIFLSEKERDYIILHELCHLKEFNHSERFWLLICRLMPDYIKIKKELKKVIL